MNKAAKAELTRFKAFFTEGGVEIREDCIPSTWKSLSDLEFRYNANLERAQAQEVRAQEQLSGAREQSYATKGDLLELDAEIVGSFGQLRDQVLIPLGEEVRRLKSEVSALKETSLTFSGVWREGQEHSLNQLCQHKGQLWLCLAVLTKEQPGSGPGWRLLGKGGV